MFLQILTVHFDRKDAFQRRRGIISSIEIKDDIMSERHSVIWSHPSTVHWSRCKRSSAPLEVLETFQEIGYDGINSDQSSWEKWSSWCLRPVFQQGWLGMLEEWGNSAGRPGDASIQIDERDGTIGTRNNLQGLQASFLRKNMALLVMLKNLKENKTIMVAVLHLYWNRKFRIAKPEPILAISWIWSILFCILANYEYVKVSISMLFDFQNREAACAGATWQPTFYLPFE